jgi:hypothetical protein
MNSMGCKGQKARGRALKKAGVGPRNMKRKPAITIQTLAAQGRYHPRAPYLTLASICPMGPESVWGMVPFGTLPELSAIGGLAGGPVGVRSTYPGTPTP